jgi:hypothetical protein
MAVESQSADRVIHLARQLFAPERAPHIRVQIEHVENADGSALARAKTYCSADDERDGVEDMVERRFAELTYVPRLATHHGGFALTSTREQAAEGVLGLLADELQQELADRTAKLAGRRSA